MQQEILRNLQISRKKGQPRERRNEIFEAKFRKVCSIRFWTGISGNIGRIPQNIEHVMKLMWIVLHIHDSRLIAWHVSSRWELGIYKRRADIDRELLDSRNMSLDVSIDDYWSSTARYSIRERCKFMFNNEHLSDVKFVVQDAEGGSERRRKKVLVGDQ